jgi:colicin import membrane protein
MGATKNSLEAVQWDLHEQPQEEPKPFFLANEVNPLEFGLEPVKAQEMVSGLSVVIAEREVLKNAYLDVIDLEINEETLPVFKELRLKIVKNRTQGIEKWHKTNKAFYLAGGRFVDAIKNKEIAENEQMESKLLEAEKYFENLEKEAKSKLNTERLERIAYYVDDTTGLDFSEMNDYDFDDYVLGKKTRFENEAKEREAEALRIENERLVEIEKQKAIQAENERLKKEAEAKEDEMQKERAEAKAKQEAIELKAKQEREKAEAERKIEADKQAKIQAKKDAEIKRLNDEKTKAENERLAKIEAERLEAEQLAKAGVNEQLKQWIDSFNIEMPNHLKNNVLANEILSKFLSFKSWSNNQIK